MTHRECPKSLITLHGLGLPGPTCKKRQFAVRKEPKLEGVIEKFELAIFGLTWKRSLWALVLNLSI